MQFPMLFFGLLVLFFGIWYSLKKHSAHDINQAALLPFADDPEVAETITKTTGVQFDKIVNGIESKPEIAKSREIEIFSA
ncbi:hypothetical protein ACX3YC_10560 [Pseudomonas mohnii]